MVTKDFHYLPIFGIDIFIRVYDNIQAVGKAYKRYAHKHNLDSGGNWNTRGMVIDDYDNCALHIWFSREDLDLDLLTHECAHLTHAVLRFHNMNKKNDQEVYSILNGYLNQTIANKLKKKGITIV